MWDKLKQNKKGPILVLAPMADVTDRAFRQMIATYGKPDAMWTEFVSADGLFLGGQDALINDLVFSEIERPIVAQFFTSRPDMMERAAKLAAELGFDGIDINMGCPDKSVEKQGAGAALIRTPALAQEIIYAAKAGAGSIPVSVKTRIGWNTNEIETWVPKLLETNPAVLTMHARTRKELSLVPARWEHIARIVEIRNELQSNTLIFGNGDVVDINDAKQKALDTGCDGVMLGRAIFGNPWLFNPEVSRDSISIADRLRTLVEHTNLFAQIVQPKPPVGQGKSFAVMKKHYKAYVTGWDGAKELRIQLMEAQDAQEVETIISQYIATL